MLNRVQTITQDISINNIIVSVFRKDGIIDFVRELRSYNNDLHVYSTGGTFRHLKKNLGNILEEKLISITDYTNQPEMQGGLVKTLDWKIYLGLLSESFNLEHQDDLKRTNAVSFDMVVVNVYPFQEIIAQKDITIEDARAHIDIGGPTMLRASAKNFLRVTPLCDVQDYPKITKELQNNNGKISLQTRFKLAQKVFALTSAYDNAIASFFLKRDNSELNQVYESKTTPS